MWIQDYREREGLELYELQERINIHGKEMNPPLYGMVSTKLIHLLERSKNPITHPHIASAIADVCGATPEQYDEIVAEQYRGYYRQVTDQCSNNAE